MFQQRGLSWTGPSSSREPRTGSRQPARGPDMAMEDDTFPDETDEDEADDNDREDGPPRARRPGANGVPGRERDKGERAAKGSGGGGGGGGGGGAKDSERKKRE